MDFNQLNKSELLELLRLQTGRRVSTINTQEELITMLNGEDLHRFAKTEGTRAKLQIFIEKNWELYQTNLPCRGKPNEGKCTIFRCPDGRHVNCYMNVQSQMSKE